jgi:hypothetical protein
MSPFRSTLDKPSVRVASPSGRCARPLRAAGYAPAVLLAVLAGVIVLGALLWLVLALVRTWKHIAQAGRDVAAAGDRLADAAATFQSAETPRAPLGRTGPGAWEATEKF